MLLHGYRKEILRPECNPSFQSVHCIAHLDEDVTDVLPYLNTMLGGTHYVADPPSLMLKVYGKLITIYSRKIAINALGGEEEAERILMWLKEEINEAWEKRSEIQPTYKDMPKPKILEVLKRLPRTNCRKCGQPTCMVFASLVAEEAKTSEDCPILDNQNKRKLAKYIEQFKIPDGFLDD